MPTSIYQKRMYQKRRSLGLCVDCGNPAENGACRCLKCSTNKNNEKALNYRLYQSYGVCPICKVNSIIGDEKTCPECRATSVEYSNDWHRKNRDQYNQTHRTWAKMEYANRKELGICTRCGKRKSINGRVMCGICADKARKQKEKKRSSAMTKSERIENGICYFCDNPVKKGYKVCEEHYQKNLENLKHPKCVEATNKEKKRIHRIIQGRKAKNERICN